MIDVVCFKLFDFDIFEVLVCKIGCCVIVYEVLKSGGFGGEIVVSFYECVLFDLWVLI